MKIERKFLVTCCHVSQDYCLYREPITVEKNPGIDGWCWSHKVFGCSKDYKTPEQAIESMLRDHACRGIVIEQVEPVPYRPAGSGYAWEQ